MADPPASRVQHDLEAKIAFLEREIDHLRSELRDAWKRLAAVEVRLDRLAPTRHEDREDDAAPGE